MAGNPRKFSEKIAIQQRKLNEEKNEFESIMSEVSMITRGDPVSEAPNLCPPGGWQRTGGSLPNVYRLTQQSHTMMLPPDQMSMYAGQWPGPSDNSRMAAMQPRDRSPGAVVHGHHSHIYHPYRPVSPHSVSPRNVSPSRQMSADIGPQAPPQYPGSHHHMYLVPPQDTSWRRTHSDPGIHASVMHPTMPGVQQSALAPTGNSHHGDMTQVSLSNANFLDPKGNMNTSHMRPRSCENVPHLPNINIQPSEPVSGPQISISTNTGSLPDLPSSLLPAHMQAQKLEDVIGSQPPPSYSQSATYTSGGQSGSAAPVSNVLQQRHSIQFPVQYPQGVMTGGQKHVYGGTGQNFMSHQSYPPESPRSASGSPNEGISVGHQGETPASSPQVIQPQSPGSPYCALQTQMQNVNIVDPQSQATYSNQQQQGYFGVNASGSCYGSQPASSTPYQQYSAMSSPQMQMQKQQQQQQQQQHQMYQALMMQQQQQQQHYHQQMQHHQGMHMQPSSPQCSQIPNIVFTGTDGSVHGNAASRNVNGDGLFVDADVELLSSDLRMSLDPLDLECLHGLGNEQGLHIDAASEDELRQDRA